MSRHVTRMELEDAIHIPEERRASLIASYPTHERDARIRGIPVLGSGRVFPIADDLIGEEAIQIPAHWPKIGGIDIGWDHPTAAVMVAWDRDSDVVHVCNTYRVREQTPVIHAASLLGWGKDLPWAWPHDALQHDKGSGSQIADQYRSRGLNMLFERAQFEDGSFGLEAGVSALLDRMQTNRFKVARHLSDWWEEFRMYHRKDGIIVKERDDLMSATRYACMMLRFAETDKKEGRWTRPEQKWIV
jgi:hypothetical protein